MRSRQLSSAVAGLFIMMITDGGGSCLYARGKLEGYIEQSDKIGETTAPDHVGAMLVSVKDFGAAGNGTADDLGAFQRAIASFPMSLDTLTASYAGTLYVPPGDYYLGGTLNIERQIRIVGASPADGNMLGASRLTFADNINGIVIHEHRTSSTGKGADGTIIENLGIVNKKNGSGTVGSGIWLRTRAHLKHIVVQGFREYGIRIEASSGGSLNGNANGWTITDCRSMSNGLDGLFIDGADVNAGVAIRMDASSNGRWGIFDSSFLGNTFVQAHAAANAAGPYKTDNANARSVFLGCYSEGGQPPSTFQAATLVLGGLHGAGFAAESKHQYFGDGRASPFRVSSAGGSTELNVGADYIAASDGLLALKDKTENRGVWPFRLRWATGRFYIDRGDAPTPLLELTNSMATVANGYARDTQGVAALSKGGGIAFPNGLMFGASRQYWGEGVSAPKSGSYVQGDRIINRTPTELGSIGNKYVITGWICTVGGTPGTWVEMRNVTGN